MISQSRDSSQSTKFISKSSSRACEECNRKKARCQSCGAPLYTFLSCLISTLLLDSHNQTQLIRSGDRRYPACFCCKRFGKVCVYPTKRRGPDPKYRRQQLQRDLLECKMSGELDELLSIVDISILQSVVTRRLSTVNTPHSQATDHGWQYDGKGYVAQTSLPDTTSLQIDRASLMEESGLDYSLGGTLMPSNDDGFDVWCPNSSWGSMSLDILSSNTINNSPLDGACLNVLGIGDSTPTVTDQAPMEGMLTSSKISKSLAFSQDTCSLETPAEIVDDLIETFFRRVQGFVPLLHRPKVLQKYNVHGSDESRYQNLQSSDAYVLLGMFALSARFSSHPYFTHTAPKERGPPFAARAKSIYIDLIGSDKPERSSLSFLQGCVLLAYYEETRGPSFESWLSIGVCSRLASELGLDKIDEDLIKVDQMSQWRSTSDWVEREEKRRAWWLVWELDVFASTVLDRPRAIDKSQIHVLIPVSDAQWFTYSPLASTFLISDVANTWKTLQDCPNQDVRAWFLVCTFFMATAHDISRTSNVSAQDLVTFDSSRGCFSLLLPLTFSLSSCPPTFTENNFSTNNWVILTIFMLNTIRVFTKDFRNARYKTPASDEPTTYQANSVNYPPHRGNDNDMQLVFRAIRAWHPDFIAFACPFVVCTLVGPAAANIRHSGTANSGHAEQDTAFNASMIRLVLERIDYFWDIASSALSLVKCLQNRQKDNTDRKEQKISSRLSVLVPIDENDQINDFHVPGISTVGANY